MSEYRKPLPRPTPTSKPFWDAARDGKLLVQACRNCGILQHPPKPLCASCWSAELDWRECSGRGTVYSYTVGYRPSTRGFREEVPYIVAIVELAEGPRLTTNIIGCPPGEVRIGMAVEAVFDSVTEAVTLIKFKPAAGYSSGAIAIETESRSSGA